VNADFEYTVSDCYNVTFRLTDKKIKKLKTVRWVFGDGNNSAKISPEHLYANPGTYKITAITTSLTGCRDTITRKIQLQALQTDYTFSEEGSPGEIKFRVKNNKAAYQWDMGDETNIKGESSFIHTYTKSGNYTARLFAKNNSGCTDTVEKRIIIELPEMITSLPVQEDTATMLIPIDTDPLEKRTRDVVVQLEVENDSVTVALYDNGIIDGDSITLVFNNTTILTHQLLKTKPLILRLKIDPNLKNNELLMYAENLGSIPPNTALMLISDGEKRYSVNVSSTQKSNGVIYFSPMKRKTLVNVSQ
jgi:PKD repeat protein